MPTADKPIRAILDVGAVPWQVYRLSGDGRKCMYVCMERRMVAEVMARYSNPDGSGIWASVETMAGHIGICPRTFRKRCDELVKLGFLKNGTQHGQHGGRNRDLNVAAIVRAGQGLQDTKSGLQDSGLQDSQGCTIETAGLHDSGAGLHDSAFRAASHTVQPTALPTALPTASLPPATADGGMVSSEILRLWQTKLPPPMNTEAMGRHEKEIARWAKGKGERLATAYVIAWINRRETKGLRDLWGAFLKEWPLHDKEALSMTPEGQELEKAADKAREDAAIAFVQKCDREQWGDAEQPELSPEEARRILLESK